MPREGENMSDDVILHSMPKVGQHNTKTCWVAAYRMVYAWKHHTRDTATVLAEAKKKLKEADLDTESELYPENFEKAAIAIGIWPMATKSMRDYEQFLWCIERSPIWCVGTFSGGPHAVVVSGIRKERKILTLNDPWEIATQGTDAKTEMFHDKWSETIADFKASCQMWYLGRN